MIEIVGEGEREIERERLLMLTAYCDTGCCVAIVATKLSKKYKIKTAHQMLTISFVGWRERKRERKKERERERETGERWVIQSLTIQNVAFFCRTGVKVQNNNTRSDKKKSYNTREKEKDGVGCEWVEGLGFMTKRFY